MSRQELSEFQKGQRDGAARFGHTPTEIEKVLGFARTTIRHIITRIKTRRSSENKERVGRPRKSLDRDERLLIQKALDDTKMPLRELKFEANSDLLISYYISLYLNPLSILDRARSRVSMYVTCGNGQR
jgi:hypothetical protein